MRTPRLLAWAVLLATSVSAAAPAGLAKKPAAPAEPPLPAAPIVLTITPGPGAAPWRMQLLNKGELPVRIPADPRLLVLDLTPPAPEPVADVKGKRPAAAPASLRCILPDDARPATDDVRELVIPASRSWSATFDPLFYCFGAKEQAALVSGTSVTAHFGWPAAARAQKAPATQGPAAPPFAVSPVGAAVGKLGPSKALTADSVTLSTGVATTMPDASEPSTSGADSGQSPVTLTAQDTLDAARGIELGTTVTLKNDADKPIVLLYRPELLLFSVVGPGGARGSCGFPRQVSAPIRELFTTIPAKGKAEVGVLFTTTCPAGTFDEPGIYRVTPRLDTTGASGRIIGLKTWDGIARAKMPLVVRVRTPRKPKAPTRPTLD